MKIKLKNALAVVKTSHLYYGEKMNKIYQFIQSLICGDCSKRIFDLAAENLLLEYENKELNSKLAPPKAPLIKGKISGIIIDKLYREIFPEEKDRIHISDGMYEITSISEMRRFVDWSKVDRLKYIKNIRDCDNFSIGLVGEFAVTEGWSGFPVGIIWGDLYGGHAFVTCVAWDSLENKTPTVYYIEPQSDNELAQEIVEDMKLWLLVL